MLFNPKHPKHLSVSFAENRAMRHFFEPAFGVFFALLGLLVAGFIGAPAMNFVDIKIDAGRIRYGAHSLDAPGSAPDATRMGIRPEHMILGAVADGDIAAEVTLCETLGGDAYLYVRTEVGDTLVVRAEGDTRLQPGDRVGLGLPAHRLHLFGADGATLVSGSAKPGQTV